MSTDKEKLVKGLYHLAFAFPFIFAGPSIWSWAGFFSADNYVWPAIGLICMISAVFLIARGLRITLRAFFEGNN